MRRVALALLAEALSACATAHLQRETGGITACVAGASNAPLSVEALECWFTAPHGRWRTLSHESHFDVLVVQAEAADLRDAEAIARALAATQRGTLPNLRVCVRPPPRGPPPGMARPR